MVGTRDARRRFYNRSRWDHGGGHVGLWSCLGLILNYVVLVLGNEDAGPHHMQGHHTRCLRIDLRKLVVSNIQIGAIFLSFFSDGNIK